MRLNLDESMKAVLNDVISNALEIAVASKDDQLIEAYNRMKKIISQSHYRTMSKDDIETIWHFSDVGERTCDFLMDTATTPDQFEKTAEVKEIYSKIKNLINEVVATKHKLLH